MWIFKKKNKQSPDTEHDQYTKEQEKYDKKIKIEEQRSSFRNRIHNLRFPTYTKNLVAVIVLVCLIDLQVSYILAFLGKDPCLDLSIKLCETVLAVACAYIFRAYFDNRAERMGMGVPQPPSIVKEIIENSKENIDKLINNKSNQMSGDEEFFEEFNNPQSLDNNLPPQEDENNV